MARLSIVIPTREENLNGNNITLTTLQGQTWRDFKVIIQHDFGKGANWARNAGFKYVDTELVMFCDDDIEWTPDAMDVMVKCLDKNPEAAYVYCGYTMGTSVYCMRPFDSERLKKINFISTMSILRTNEFIGFDENIKRFQDWDLWLTLLSKGKVGVWCGLCLFHTQIRDGITYNNDMTPIKATNAIWKKHGIL